MFSLSGKLFFADKINIEKVPQPFIFFTEVSVWLNH